jgi:hypothetical protein
MNVLRISEEDSAFPNEMRGYMKDCNYPLVIHGDIEIDPSYGRLGDFVATLFEKPHYIMWNSILRVKLDSRSIRVFPWRWNNGKLFWGFHFSNSA